MIGKAAVPRANAKQLGAYLMQQQEQEDVPTGKGGRGVKEQAREQEGDPLHGVDDHGKKLAAYLRHDKNEKVRCLDVYGCAARTVEGAMQEMADIGNLSSRCKQYVFHMAFRTPEGVSMTDAQKLYAVETYEKLLDLKGHQRVVVIHENKGHEHTHVVWNRIDIETVKAKNMSFSKLKIHAASRILEYDLGHEYTQSGEYSHKAICGILKEHGREDVVKWIEREHEAEKAIKEPYTRAEEQQARIKGIDLAEVSRDLKEAWLVSDTGKSFAAALDERGYILAQGTRRDLVVVDSAGGVHSPARRIDGIKTKDIQDKCSDINKAVLPSVEQAKGQQGERARALQDREQEQVKSADKAFDTRAEAQRKALTRFQELRMNRQERLVEAQHKEREKQVIARVQPPEPEKPLGVAGKVLETVVKAVNPKFKTRDERQKEKEEKHRQIIEDKKKRIEQEKKEKLAAYVQMEEKRRIVEEERLEKQIAEMKQRQTRPLTSDKEKDPSKERKATTRKPPEQEKGRERDR